MSDQMQLVVYFFCGHTEVTIVDTQESSQKNRNLWSRVKKWTLSPSPSETKHRQSASLCTQCSDTERKQIEMAARLQEEMAQNAAQKLKAQGQLLAAPPAQGQKETIAALILPGDKALHEALLKAQLLNASKTDTLEVAEYEQWQLEAARQAQRDLDRAFRFWENVHLEHASLVKKITRRSGPTFCPECKKLATSLANPNYRREIGYSDVRLPEGLWYGSDPWSTISPPDSTVDVTETILAQEPTDTHIPEQPQSPPPLEPAPVESPTRLQLTITYAQKIRPGEEGYKSQSKEMNNLQPSREPIGRLADIEDVKSSAPVQDFIQQINRNAKPLDQIAMDAEERAHLREMEANYLKVLESRNIPELVIHPPEDEEAARACVSIQEQDQRLLSVQQLQGKQNETTLLPLPQLNQDRLAIEALSNDIPALASPVNTLQSPEMEAKWRRYRYQYDKDKERMAILRNNMKIWEAILDEKLYRIAISAARSVASEIGKKLPPLPSQGEEELEALNSGEQTHGENTTLRPEDSTVNQDPGSSPTNLQSCPSPPSAVQTTAVIAISLPNGPPPTPQRPRRPSTPNLPPINPFSPVGLQAIQQIRDFFYIPSNVPPSQFPEFLNQRIEEGMMKDRMRGPPSFGVYDGDIRFQGNKVWMKSHEKDLQKRKEILELSERIEWNKTLDTMSDGKSSWEKSSDDDEQDEDSFDIEDVRKLKVDKFMEAMFAELHDDSDGSPSATSPGEIEAPPRSITPSPYHLKDEIEEQGYVYEASEEEWNTIDHYYSDDDIEEVGPRLVWNSSPISEDPKSPHRVKRRSPLREEVVVVDQNKKESQ